MNISTKPNIPSVPTQKGALVQYFNTEQGTEFIKAVKLHLENNSFDVFGAIQAGVNKAVENRSIVFLLYAVVNDLTPLFVAIIQYIEGKNKLNRTKTRLNRFKKTK
jgi:hypothetical protein